MRKYELVVVLKSALKEEDRKKMLDSIKSWLKDNKITKEEDWGSKVLAYPIKHEEAGYYYDFLLETETAIPEGFEKKLLSHDSILRHLLVRTK